MSHHFSFIHFDRPRDKDEIASKSDQTPWLISAVLFAFLAVPQGPRRASCHCLPWVRGSQMHDLHEASADNLAKWSYTDICLPVDL
eukprot:scaffold312717_cov50-Prasinocladus_malaysianus.AAC.2